MSRDALVEEMTLVKSFQAIIFKYKKFGNVMWGWDLPITKSLKEKVRTGIKYKVSYRLRSVFLNLEVLKFFSL